MNEVEEVMIATLHSNQHVEKGKVLAGTRVIPLVVSEEKVARVEQICGTTTQLVRVMPYDHFAVGIVTTGSEVFSGRNQDKFGPVIREKVERYGSTVMRQVLVTDSAEQIAAAVTSLADDGAQLVAVTGGMSVDPDDVSPILGLPGCVMYNRTTIFDLLLPRILIGERLCRLDIIELAHGGLCVGCDVCRYPDCGFGKG